MNSRAIKEQKKRDYVSILVALAIHLLIVLGFLISHLVFYKDIEEYRGPVLIKLGRSDDIDEVSNQVPSTVKENEETSREENISESLKPEELKEGELIDSASTLDSEDPSAIKTPQKEGEIGDQGDSQDSLEKESMENQLSGEKVPVKEEEVVVRKGKEEVVVRKGKEEGNSYETTYSTSSESIGRNIWVPIIWYLPVPQYLNREIFDSIKSDDQIAHRPGNRTSEEKISLLLKYYQMVGNEYYLNSPPLGDERPQIWSILEDSDYNLQKAEYKEGKNLRPIVLTFTIESKNEETQIVDVKIERSSGYGEIDDAVLYGFSKSSFYNSSENAVKGRFTYRFD